MMHSYHFFTVIMSAEPKVEKSIRILLGYFRTDEK